MFTTVALPIISAAGIETTVPDGRAQRTRAVLQGIRSGSDRRHASYHGTGDHSAELDAIYTYYLGSSDSLILSAKSSENFFSSGSLSRILSWGITSFLLRFTADFPAGWRASSQADVIVPNMTEAALMLGLSYEEGPYKVSYVEEILGRLSHLGPRQVVLKGVYFSQGEFGAACYDAGKKAVSYFMDRKIDGIFYGTGDVFSSALTAAADSGLSLERAVDIAQRFTVGRIGSTARAGTDRRLGVNFEEGLWDS